MTHDELKEAAERHGKRWVSLHTKHDTLTGDWVCDVCPDGTAPEPLEAAVVVDGAGLADYVAAALTAVPELLAEIDRMRRVVAAATAYTEDGNCSDDYIAALREMNAAVHEYLTAKEER